MTATEATSRLERIMGREGLERLAASTVMVLGLGGVGSNCVEALARGGVGSLVLIDRDAVEASNINRQAIAFRSTIGQRKVDAMRAMVADINPSTVVVTRDLFVEASNLEALFDDVGAVDYVVDAIDTIAQKLAIAQLAQKRGFRLISSMGAANKLDPGSLRFADLHDTMNDPICRVMRKEARRRGIDHLNVLYSCEQPLDIPMEEGSTRSERTNLGTASYIPPIMGQMIAGEVLCELAGIKQNRG